MPVGTQQAPSMIGAQLQVLLLQPMVQIAKAQSVKRQADHLGSACRSTRVEPFTPTAMHKLTSTCMIGSSLIHVHGVYLCHLSWDSLQDAPKNHDVLHGNGNCSKFKLLSHQRWLLKLLQPE